MASLLDAILANAAKLSTRVKQAPSELRQLGSQEFAAQFKKQLDANLKKPKEIDSNKAIASAMDILQTTPAGAMAGMIRKTLSKSDEFFGMHGATDLGDKVLTESAKEPGKFQLTLFDGKLGQSNTVKDMQFDSKEEAIKAFNSF